MFRMFCFKSAGGLFIFRFFRDFTNKSVAEMQLQKRLKETQIEEQSSKQSIRVGTA